jgi:hypothetical protein
MAILHVEIAKQAKMTLQQAHPMRPRGIFALARRLQ